MKLIKRGEGHAIVVEYKDLEKRVGPSNDALRGRVISEVLIPKNIAFDFDFSELKEDLEDMNVGHRFEFNSFTPVQEVYSPAHIRELAEGNTVINVTLR